ncbi:7-cyano-7-deazaguanine synthase QueC [Sphingomonas kyeonggiensis]|uniref:7-cyano-7-deazaguanine synthase n=1 Tax=Sphingomonas kyeonggiensis TaxID=1268553 RepID=A0A7W6NXT0_9SPHN|nr:7-cyano-7-deazaguanine synthase QueC [Sphingomonas kyeonggiensis]MBB4100489.1 7-cyano-7-deazaguanine synthase [Sphingomonas kyeonggiensis]
MSNADSSALVVFSGGQDSVTCLAWALNRFDRVETIGFHYGQRHEIELKVRAPLRAQIADAFPAWAPRLGPDRIIDLAVLGEMSLSALTSDIDIGMRDDGLPTTFVPGRNLIFLTLAAIVAYQRGLKHVVTGVCETDYSGYPDCRDDTIKALQAALNLGMASRIVLDTPLMWIDKEATWRLAYNLGGDTLVEIIRTESHSCYQGDRTQLYEWGYGCGSCPACELRAVGWRNYSGRPPT